MPSSETRAARPARPRYQHERALLAVRSRPRPAGPLFVSAGAYQAPAGRDAAPHRYAVWKLTYYVSGHIQAHIDSLPYRITPGTVLVVPPHAAHAEIARTEYSNIFVLVHAPERWPWPAVVPPHGLPDADRVFAAMLAEMAGEDAYTSGMTEALTSQLDLALRRHIGPATRAAQIVADAEQLMFERYSSHLPISGIAQELAVSVSTLRAYFAAERGCSPRDRLRDIRLRHAAALLQACDLTVEAVALRCGFHSASHLSRYVHAVHGQSPKALRFPS